MLLLERGVCTSPAAGSHCWHCEAPELSPAFTSAPTTGLGSGPEAAGRPSGDEREVDRSSGQNNNNVPPSSRSPRCASHHCTCDADQLPRGRPGSEPPLQGLRCAGGRLRGRVCVIKNEHASLRPWRCHHLAWHATAVCWLCGSPAVQPGIEGRVGLGSAG